jgi:CRISPR/Cas system-associated endoribonuclease Cas2
MAREVQYSVFGTHLSDRGLERLRWELEKVMDPKDGLLTQNSVTHA